MVLRTRSVLITLASTVLFGQAAWAQITSAVRGGASTRCAPAVAPAPLDEDSLSFCDRAHQYNEIPASVKGAQYIMVSNDDKGTADFSLTVTLDRDGTLLLFLDNRIGDNTNTNPPTLGGGVMDWVLDLGFADTGLDIGVDEGADGDIDQRSSIYQLAVNAGDTVLLQQNNGGSRNMYGVAFVSQPLASKVPSAGTIGLVALAVLLLGAGALVLRRRPAMAS